MMVFESLEYGVEFDSVPFELALLEVKVPDFFVLVVLTLEEDELAESAIDEEELEKELLFVREDEELDFCWEDEVVFLRCDEAVIAGSEMWGFCSEV